MNSPTFTSALCTSITNFQFWYRIRHVLTTDYACSSYPKGHRIVSGWRAFLFSILSVIFRNVDSFRSTLLWVGLLTVLLSCEWGLILLYYAQGNTGDNTVAIFLAAIAIFHAIASFIHHCLCNIKVRILIFIKIFEIFFLDFNNSEIFEKLKNFFFFFDFNF